MKRRIFVIVPLAAFVLGLGLAAFSPALRAQAGLIAEQVLSNTIYAGASARGAGVLQTGEVSTLSAAVASATRAKVLTASTGTSIYLRGIFIEKAATSTGLVTVTQGTGTNCGTSPVVMLSLAAAASQILPFGYQPIGIQVPAAKDLCLTTEGANTSVRALAQ